MSETKKIVYRFTLEDQQVVEFAVELELPALGIVGRQGDIPPEWCALTFRQCQHCPLDEADHPWCPVARNLAPVIQTFAAHVSCEEVDLTVVTTERTFERHGPLQNGLSSLVGLVMATSGCPFLDRLRPMVYTHLPFSDSEQTTFRAVSTYLLAQYLRSKRGLEPDWSLSGLVEMYADIGKVNQCFAERLRSFRQMDASMNALVKLDWFANMSTFSVVEDWWEPIEPLFFTYLD